tara:strand:+ start:485 stop:856 length:372 start_codon:yes stop_codon:yes gene_type:complete
MAQYERIQIPMKVYSRNAMDKKHWSEKKSIRQIYSVLVRNQMRLTKKREVGTGEVVEKIRITAYLKRLYDFDNLVGGCKQLIDALSNEGFIWDDAPRFLNGSEYKQMKTKGEPFTIIERKFNV